jgi:hypothetical protein
MNHNAMEVDGCNSSIEKARARSAKRNARFEREEEVYKSN